MKAVIYRRYGPPDVLEYAEAPEPQITDQQIRVKVRAAGVNPVDWKVRSGHPKIPLLMKLPGIPGSDLSGEVVQVGRGVTPFKVGDAVYGTLSPFSGGACAEYAAVPQKNAALKPKNLSFEEAAAVPIAGLTALKALRDLGNIKPNHRVLINGAAGGVGHFAVQIAKGYGAEVTGVAGGRNLDFVRGLGADRTIDYTREDFTRSELRYDIVFDAVAKRSFKECKPVLNRGGVFITTLPSGGTILQMFIGPILGGPTARIIALRVRSGDFHPLTEWIEAGKVRPVIDRRFPLSQTVEAHRYGETGHARGKIVIRVGEY
jgi:NADPH:quinone reductase-like Zn-dependent oxidoreductase